MLDLVLSGATVVTGDGPARVADVGVRDGRIAVVAEQVAVETPERIDATGLLLCPGFIDAHAHTALQPFVDPLLRAKVAQGYTTDVVLPDGLGPAPVAATGREARRAYLRPLEGPGPEVWPWSTVAEYLAALDAARPAISLAPSVPHGAIRELVVGSADVRATPAQLEAMRSEVRAAIDAGCGSLSFGLVYLPGAYADTAELDAVAAEAGRVGIPLVPHVRNEGEDVLAAMQEMLGVAERAGAPLHVSHLKALSGEHLVEPLLALLEAAATRHDVTFDQYPYGAGSTLLASVLPAWAQAGGAAGTLERLASNADRARIMREIRDGRDGWENILGTLGPERIEIAAAATRADEVVGRSLSAIAAARDIDPIACALDVIAESHLDVTMILHYATDDAVRTIAAHPLQMVGSDGIFGPRPHPRLHGTAARFLGRFALREGLLPLEEAVGRLTWRPADRFGLRDRGRIRPGLRADLTLVDPARLLDTATYADPVRDPDGVIGVWVAGERMWRDGGHTGARPGRVARRVV